MKISVTMTARDLFQFSLYNSYSGFSGAFNVIFTLGALAILAVTWNWETINVYQRILLVFCALIFTVVQPLMLDRKAKQQAGAIGFSAPLNLTLGDEKIDVEKAGMTGELFWNQVWKVVRIKSMYIVVLMALNILEGMDLSAGHDDPETAHKIMEALKLAFTDGKRYVADPRAMKPTVEQLLSRDYAAKRRALIGSTALEPKPGTPYCGDTVYLNAADGDGNMISYIQSIYCGFGSGTVLPGTGIVFHNRGNNFTMDETMENCVAPGKKPYHTIIPGFLSKDGKAVGPFGVMGGFMQPQGHVQVLTNMIDFHMNPQEALDAPRWMWTGEKKISLERLYNSEMADKLTRTGHDITIPVNSLEFGRGQIILRDDDGTLCGATEPRTDGTVAVW